MIIPWLKGFVNWHKAPMTWALIILNAFVFCLTVENRQPSMTRDLLNVDSLILTGRLFHQFKNSESEKIPLYSTSQWMILGSQGLKNAEFLEKAPATTFSGDQISIGLWKGRIANYQRELSEKNSKLLGLHSVNSSGVSWLTYQFMHAGWFHLFCNMMMLLLFSAALEQTVGALALVCIYLLSGFAGAGIFILLSPASLAPMIGASGSLSGIMAFYAAYEKKKRVSFFYFISPLKGYFGWIYLPTLMLFPLCFLSDFAGYLSTPIEIGAGIAYSAHIGGALFGALAGFSLRYFRKHLLWQWIAQH